MDMYPFTPEGVQQKQSELYELGDEELMQQAKDISSDFVSWVNNNFELDDEQRVYLQELPENDALINGWQTASAVLFRQEVSIEDTTPPEGIAAAEKKKKKKKLTVAGTATYNPTTEQTTSGVSVSFSWEWD